MAGTLERLSIFNLSFLFININGLPFTDYHLRAILFLRSFDNSIIYRMECLVSRMDYMMSQGLGVLYIREGVSELRGMDERKLWINLDWKDRGIYVDA